MVLDWHSKPMRRPHVVSRQVQLCIQLLVFVWIPAIDYVGVCAMWDGYVQTDSNGRCVHELRRGCILNGGGGNFVGNMCKLLSRDV